MEIHSPRILPLICLLVSCQHSIRILPLICLLALYQKKKKLFEITILGTCVFPAAVFGCESRTILRSIKYKIGLLDKNTDPLSLTLTHMSPGFNLPYSFHARVILKLSTLGYTGSRSLRFCISCINTHMLH